MKKNAEIALHKEELDGFGVDLKPIQALTLDETMEGAHRDDHYMFILQQKGKFLLEIDFRELALKGAGVCFVTPGQVHRYVRRTDSQGWFLFVDVPLIAEQYRQIFDTYAHVRQVVAVEPSAVIFQSIPILEALLLEEQHSFNRHILFSQVAVLMGLVTSRLIQPGPSGQPVNGQRYQLVNQFKQSIRNNYKAVKQVQEYAAQLNITPLYLNEVVKEITGFPASYWIQQEILLEARRLLYYTALDVKQIAYELGYEDHTYFSRFFKKHTSITALEFRARNHAMSNDPL